MNQSIKNILTSLGVIFVLVSYLIYLENKVLGLLILTIGMVLMTLVTLSKNESKKITNQQQVKKV